MLATGLAGCIGGKKLNNNEYLLYSQTIRDNKTIPSTSLEALIPQRPNRRILRLPITPGLWFYQLGSRSYNRKAVQQDLEAKIKDYNALDERSAANQPANGHLRKKYNRQIQRLRRKAEEGNWVMRVLGEPPAYFHDADAKQNANKMDVYLRNKGFFFRNVSYSIDTLKALGRRVRVNYLITENIPFHLKTITYQIADPRVDSLIRQSMDKSLLKTGERYDVDKVNGERVRIEELLRNNGYYAFTRQYIPLPLDVDSTRSYGPDSAYRNLNIWVRVVNPPGQSHHQIYKIGEVNVRVARPESRRNLDTTMYNGLRFVLGRGRYSTRLLDSRIFLRPDSLYRLRNFTETQRQLFLLNQFSFANVDFTDTTNRRLRTNITAIPLDRYDFSTETGLFVLYQGQASVPGPFGNLTFRARNLFGGLETFEASARYGIEAQTGFISTPGQARAAQVAQELGLTTSLIFPHILLPGRMRFLFNKATPRTQISLGYTNTIRPDYKRKVFRTTMSYNWLRNNAHQYTLTIADINFLRASIKNTDIGQQFADFLLQQDSLGSTIRNSFRNAFASNISFTYTYNANALNQNRRANFLRVSLESGGTTLNFFSTQQLQNIFQPTETTGLQYYKYLRANVDFRHYIPLAQHTTLAFRLNTGMVYGYGANRTAPYERLFFAGGSNSIRAWLPRRLGPGSALPQSSDIDIKVPVFNPRRPGQFAYNFEQPGDILIESSAELRNRLFHLGADINGALFVDAGNVWTLRDYNNSKIGEEFRLRTLGSQIAVGTGVGLRIDFSFFIIRLDGAIKVYDPARRYLSPEGDLVDERFFLPYFRLDQLFKGPNPLVLNFGIGYPF